MERAIRETVSTGLTRIEITYTAASVNAEEKLLDEFFATRAELDIQSVFRSLMTMTDLGYHLPLATLLNNFNVEARQEQLLIVEPTLATLAYAVNSKPGCFSAIQQVISPPNPLRHVDYLAAQALPGPNSLITCII